MSVQNIMSSAPKPFGGWLEATLLFLGTGDEQANRFHPDLSCAAANRNYILCAGFAFHLERTEEHLKFCVSLSVSHALPYMRLHSDVLPVGGGRGGESGG